MAGSAPRPAAGYALCVVLGTLLALLAWSFLGYLGVVGVAVGFAVIGACAAVA